MQLVQLIFAAFAIGIPTAISPEPNMDMVRKEDWMSGIMFAIKDRVLNDIVLPGAIDGTIKEQLENGVRYFQGDVNVLLDPIGEYITNHSSEIIAIESQGVIDSKWAKFIINETESQGFTIGELLATQKRIVLTPKRDSKIDFNKALVQNLESSSVYQELYNHMHSSSFSSKSTNSKWMTDHADTLSQKRINEIAIPGTHHSAFLSVSFWNKIPGIWSICQRLTVTEQLDIGIRSFDLRIGEKDGEMIMAHTIPSTNKLEPVLVELKSFLDANRGELVILDMNNDYGYKSNTDSARSNLKNRLNEIFGQMIITLGEFESYKFQDFISNNKRVLIIGDWRIDDIPSVGSWSITQASNWGTLVDNSIAWINAQGLDAIKQGRMASLSAAVSPKVGQDVSPPTSVADRLNALLASRLQTVTVPFNIISHDLANAELAAVVIAHNLK